MEIAAAGALLVAVPRANAQVHIIELTADSDSRYKIAGQRTPEITVKAGDGSEFYFYIGKGKGRDQTD